MIAIGNTSISNVYLGNTQVKRVYQGSKILYPYDAEIEYLQSTGTQYIDTNFKPNQDTKVEIVYNCYNIDANRIVFGCAEQSLAANARNGITRTLLSNGTGRVGFGNGTNTTVYTDSKYNRLNTEYKLFFDKTNVYFDDELANTIIDSTWQTSLSLYLFGRNLNGNINNPFVGYIKSFKVWDDTDLVMDLITVRKGTVGYMYDKVSGQLFENSGTGSFNLGPDVNSANILSQAKQREILSNQLNQLELQPKFVIGDGNEHLITGVDVKNQKYSIDGDNKMIEWYFDFENQDDYTLVSHQSVQKGNTIYE